MQAIPAYELIKAYLPKIKEKLGADSLSYLAAFLQTKLLGLQDNLGGLRSGRMTETHTTEQSDNHRARTGTTRRRGGYISRTSRRTRAGWGLRMTLH
jgi:hypothetical protein